MNGSKCIVFKMYETKSSLKREPVLDMNSGFAIKNHFEYIVVYKRSICSSDLKAPWKGSLS